MAANLDSEVVFAARAKLVGLLEPDIKLLTDGGFGTLAKFAFMSSYTPGSPSEDAFVNALTITRTDEGIF